MPYRPKTAEFWKKVTGGLCVWENYTEQSGFKECGEPVGHVHHPEGESKMLHYGKDPEHSYGVPVCENHHVRNMGKEIYDPRSSFHPEMGGAYKGYREWKLQAQHMNSITEKKTIDYSTSPFAEVAKLYKKRVLHKKRICTGDASTDRYYAEKMEEKAVRYLAENKGEKKPATKPHPEFKKKKKWYDNLF